MKLVRAIKDVNIEYEWGIKKGGIIESVSEQGIRYDFYEKNVISKAGWLYDVKDFEDVNKLKRITYRYLSFGETS